LKLANIFTGLTEGSMKTNRKGTNPLSPSERPPAPQPVRKVKEENQIVGKDIAEVINSLASEIHLSNVEAGWWHGEDGRPILDNPYAVSNKLMLVVSEVAEAMEGDRTDAMDDKLPHRKMIEVELADAVIRILDLAGAFELDVGGAIVEKRSFNKVRKDHSKESRQAKGGKKY
jgi:NTP pyrophosphatase (non-canonical NTP hydrolase)